MSTGLVRFPKRAPGFLASPTSQADEAKLSSMVFPSGSGMSPLFPTFGMLGANEILPQAKVDYAKVVGDGLSSSVLMAPLNWLMRTFPEAPPVVEKRSRQGQWTEQFPHALTTLIENPNPYYGGLELIMATVLDLAFGNAYWIKIRNVMGEVVQLWWVPRFTMWPRWSTDGKSYLTHYDYLTFGRTQEIAPDDVVHFRFGIDPRNVRLGLSPLGSLLRDIAMDDQASEFATAILKNLGVIGVVVAPDGVVAAGGKDAAKETKGFIQDHFLGENRGKALALSVPTKVNLLQYNMQGFDVSPLRDVSEERVCAALGIPAAVVGFGTGLQQTKVGAPQPLSARLWTPTGPTTMGELALGDTVAIPSGWGRVRAVYPQGERDIYRISFQDGSTAESTIDHLWDVKLPNQKDRSVLPLSEIAAMPPWKLRRASLPLQGVTEFDAQPTLIPPYVMGLLIADGSFRENLFFSNANHEIVETAKAEIAPDYVTTQTNAFDHRIAYRDHARGKGKGCGSGNVNPFKDELRRLGLWMLYSHEKFVPDLYKYNSSRVRRELLRGILDGDGFVNHHGQPAIEQTSAQLAADITWLVQSLGGYTLQTLKRANRRVRLIGGRPMQSRHDRYHLSIVIDDAPGMFRCAEKAERCRGRKKPATRKFRSIEFVRREEAQCITVDGGLYLTDNFVVTHNTMKEMRQLAWTGGLMPMQKIVSKAIDRSLLSDKIFDGFKAYEPPPPSTRGTLRMRFDNGKVAALWEDTSAKHDRVRKDWLSGMITRAEARTETGRAAGAQDNVYIQPVNVTQLDENGDPKPLSGGDSSTTNTDSTALTGDSTQADGGNASTSEDT